MSFYSAHSFLGFNYEVENNGRYILNKSQLDFLNALKLSWNKRKIIIPKNTEVFRAQISHIENWIRDNDGMIINNEILPSEDKRLIPKKEYAYEGRLNPKGIIVFYSSVSKETAMSELRPWINSLITVGTFRTKYEIMAIDLTVDQYYGIPEDESDEWKEKVVWGDINYHFSRPIVNSDTSADYASTQILAEYFKKNGFNAIVHKSSLGQEKNIVFFSNNHVELVSKEVKKVISVDYKFTDAK